MLTSRNSLAPLRAAGRPAQPRPDRLERGRLQPDPGPPGDVGRIAERRVLVLAPGPSPERRAMAFTRAGVRPLRRQPARQHGPASRARAEDELRLAAERSLEWAAGSPLILGGDLNLRPRDERRSSTSSPSASASPPRPPPTRSTTCSPAASRSSRPPRPGRRSGARSTDRTGLALRLSDHAPVEATFAAVGDVLGCRARGNRGSETRWPRRRRALRRRASKSSAKKGSARAGASAGAATRASRRSATRSSAASSSRASGSRRSSTTPSSAAA